MEKRTFTQEELDWALFLSAEQDNTVACIVLLEQGANLRARNKIGESPLHYAAEKGATDTCRVLVELGAEIDAQCDRQLTPLQSAVWNNHRKTALFLIAHGADTSKNVRIASGNTNYNGMTRRQAAMKLNDPGLLEKLIKETPAQKPEDEVSELIKQAKKAKNAEMVVLLQSLAAKESVRKVMNRVQPSPAA